MTNKRSTCKTHIHDVCSRDSKYYIGWPDQVAIKYKTQTTTISACIFILLKLFLKFFNAYNSTN